MSVTVADVEALFALPFNDLLFRAHSAHRAHFDPNAVQVSTLLSIKTGGCSEDCGYCSQSARYQTGVEREALMPLDNYGFSTAFAWIKDRYGVSWQLNLP